ncbi:MAG: hypothetical protein AB7N65_02930 [Vicinamibacterales bacterium]
MKKMWQIAVVAASLALSAGSSAWAQSNGEVLSVGEALVNAPYVDATGERGVLSGKLAVQHVLAVQAGLVVDAVVGGVLMNGAGEVIGQVSELVRLPVSTPVSECDRIRLDVGPVQIQVAGLPVTLAPTGWMLKARGADPSGYDVRLCQTAAAIGNRAPAGDVALALEGLLRPPE